MFFSVKRSMKIAGKTYIPCVCYPATKFLERTVQKLSEEGKAVLYSERVFFQNGKVIKKPVVKKTLTTSKPKKDKKEKKVENKTKETETVPLEAVDESEGF